MSDPKAEIAFAKLVLRLALEMKPRDYAMGTAVFWIGPDGEFRRFPADEFFPAPTSLTPKPKR